MVCTFGIGAYVWVRLTGLAKPPRLHKFLEIRGFQHTAVSLRGDFPFYIRSQQRGLNFEFETQLLDNIELADAAKETQKSDRTPATIAVKKGVEHDILRDDMPFGSSSRGK